MRMSPRAKAIPIGIAALFTVLIAAVCLLKASPQLTYIDYVLRIKATVTGARLAEIKIKRL
jgi:hypothetical protein